jgi:hypothetical protein
MKIKGWFVSALVIGGVFFSVRTMRGCLTKAAPDQELAARFDDLCEIARDGTSKPEAGVTVLGRYLAAHFGDLLGNFGDTLALIEGVADDDDHDARAALARERLQKPLTACETDWQRFADAIEADPKARAMIEKAMIRFNRTLDILVGKQQLTLRNLPQQLQHLLDAPAR